MILENTSKLLDDIYSLLGGDRIYFQGWATEESHNIFLVNGELLDCEAQKAFILSYFKARPGFEIRFKGILQAFQVFEGVGFDVIESEAEEIEIEREIPF